MNDTDCQETVQLSCKGRIVYCGSKLLDDMFKAGCSDSDIVLYLYYLLKMSIHNNHILHLPLEQIKTELHWGKDKLVRSKSVLTGFGLVKDHPIRGADGKIIQHKTIILSGLDDVKITTGPETSTVVPGPVGEKENSSPLVYPPNTIPSFGSSNTTPSFQGRKREDNSPHPLKGARMLVGESEKWSVKKCPYFISRFPQEFRDNPEFVKKWTEWEVYRATSKKKRLSDMAVSATINEITEMSFSIQDVVEGIKSSMSGDYQKLVIRKAVARFSRGESNGAAKTDVQLNELPSVRLWSGITARVTANGREPIADDYPFPTRDEMLEKMVVYMENLYYDVVREPVYSTMAYDKDNRHAFFIRQAEELIQWILRLPKPMNDRERDERSGYYVKDISSLFEDPSTLACKFTNFLGRKHQKQWSEFPYSSIRFGRKNWQEFLKVMESEYNINLVTGRRIR